MERETENILIYGNDVDKNKTGCGPGSIARCKRGLDFILTGDDRNHAYTIYLGAGHQKGYTGQKTLKELMAYYLLLELLQRGYTQMSSNDGVLLSNGTTSIRIIQVEKQAWSTFPETEAVVAELLKRGQSGNVWVISNAFHSLRIQLIWQFFRFDGFKARPFMLVESVTVPQMILESIKAVKVLILGSAYLCLRLFRKKAPVA